ncbi:hypothetical protein [Legionella feeleii]|uniref:Uncharacterized protein n=1 Tax=Legionella feeleii TaxID=453 RepID=A0A0W0THW4_9GAMM|nr:hypothetical protein [Legionella feeleii]KTC95201.1 hypothetical protein Lfee_2865 [Legionella feeleii]SPX62441.1 Uncharacterised protein [Legionella feeleii]
MIKFNDEWLPKIDGQYIADEIIKKLAIQKERLTGNQVKYIRSYFSMPQPEFGKTVVHESHSAVRKWEKCRDEITTMNENTEHRFTLLNRHRLRPKPNKRISIQILKKAKYL